MVVICIDIGNTRLKVARVTAGRVRRLAALSTAEALARQSEIRRLMADVGRADGVAICSVVPRLTAPVRRVMRRATDCRAVEVRHDVPLPFQVRVPRPAELGTDRICAAAGALGARRSVIVVDIGSAVTADLVSDGAYLGGYIFAGPQLGLDALGRAAQLPRLDYRGDRRLEPPFRSSAEAMRAGVTVATAAAVQAAVARLRRRSGGRPAVVVTGGAAPALRAMLPEAWVYDPDAVFRGLRRIWELNRSGLR